MHKGTLRYIKNIIFLTAHFSTLLVHIAQNLGMQACWVACLCFSDHNFGGEGAGSMETTL